MNRIFLHKKKKTEQLTTFGDQEETENNTENDQEYFSKIKSIDNKDKYKYFNKFWISRYN